MKCLLGTAIDLIGYSTEGMTNEVSTGHSTEGMTNEDLSTGHNTEGMTNEVSTLLTINKVCKSHNSKLKTMLTQYYRTTLSRHQLVLLLD